MTFGENLRMIRISRGYTQTEFADLLGVRQSAVSGWERGAREPNFEMCEKIADILNIPMSSIISPGEITSDDDYVRYVSYQLQNSPKLRLLFDRSRKLTPSELSAVLSVTEAILKERDNE